MHGINSIGWLRRGGNKAGVGQSQFATATLAVVEVIPPEPAPLRGLVHEGYRPQAGFEVIVRDDKGAEKRRAKTDETGRFEIAAKRFGGAPAANIF